jgi:biopolymer transport protein TolQ
MFVKSFLLSINPFYDAYIHSDFLGRLIFISLILLSICSWIIIIYKVGITHRAQKNARQFHEAFLLSKTVSLNIDCDERYRRKIPNPFLELYLVLKKHTLDILNKNRRFGKANSSQEEMSYLSPSDITFVESHLSSAVAYQTKKLEKNLFILSTIVSLAPFLGLLGTVWGILITFSQMQMQNSGGTHQMVLGGLSLALATTVLGLIDAIPALIGYNYLRNSIRDFETDMEGFTTEILASIEMQYRQVDVR